MMSSRRMKTKEIAGLRKKRRGDMGRHPVGYEGEMRAEWDGSTVEVKPSLRKGRKLGETLIKVFAPEELAREP